MPVIAAFAGVLVVVLGWAELSLAKQDGLPGRRVGGGTRYSEQMQQIEVLQRWPIHFN